MSNSEKRNTSEIKGQLQHLRQVKTRLPDLELWKDKNLISVLSKLEQTHDSAQNTFSAENSEKTQDSKVRIADKPTRAPSSEVISELSASPQKNTRKRLRKISD
jgi:hypothetical protein